MSIVIDQILQAYDRLGHRRYGEDVTQAEHALQAAMLAEGDGAGDALVAAALLHDVGHMLEALPDLDRPPADERHEAVGAALLAGLFAPEVVQPVALHVAAKRYLCAIEPGYEAGLSAASRHSLALQGGPFTADEAKAFERLPFAAQAVRLRRYDDAAKLTDTGTPAFADFAPLLWRLAVEQPEALAQRARPSAVMAP